MIGSRMVRLSQLLLLGLGLPALLGAGPLAPGAVVGATGTHADVGADLRGQAIARAAGDTVLVAARELPRGTVLRTADIDTLVTDGDTSARARLSVSVPGSEIPAAGWVVRRLVHKGEPLRAPAVAPPALILAGSPVSLVWEVGGLRVTRMGTAVGPAHAGETVTVRVDAKRRFIGVATAPGTVIVSQP